MHFKFVMFGAIAAATPISYTAVGSLHAFRQHFMSRGVSNASALDPTGTPDELMNEYLIERLHLMNMDALLEWLHTYLGEREGFAVNTHLDSTAPISLSSIMDSTRLDEMFAGLDGLRAGTSDIESLGLQNSIDFIHEVRSSLRMIQSPHIDYVPLYTAPAGYDPADDDAISPVCSAAVDLGRIAQVVDSSEESERNTFLEVLMEAIDGAISRIMNAPKHASGAELQSSFRHSFYVFSSFPRTCALSDDPVAAITRVVDEVFPDGALCKGFLFRFVPRETRDQWLNSLKEIFDLLEQLRISGQMNSDRNVRLVTIEDHEEFMGMILEIVSDRDEWIRTGVRPNMMDVFAAKILRMIRERNWSDTEYPPRSTDLTPEETVDVFIAAAQLLIERHEYLTPNQALEFVRATRDLQNRMDDDDEDDSDEDDYEDDEDDYESDEDDEDVESIE
jgi:hypothetical protein